MSLNAVHAAQDTESARLSLGGFSSWPRVEHIAWTFREVLKANIRIFVLLDRDYRCEEEVADLKEELSLDGVECHVLERKEIENYLLVPEAIAGAIQQQRKEWGSVGKEDFEGWVRSALNEIFQEFKTDIAAHLIGDRFKYLTQRRSHKDHSTVAAEVLSQLASQWETFDGKASVSPGKDVLAQLRNRIAKEFSVSITDASISSRIPRTLLAPDLTSIIGRLNLFCKA